MQANQWGDRCTRASVHVRGGEQRALGAQGAECVQKSCSAAAWAHHSPLLPLLLRRCPPPPPPPPSRPSSRSPLHKLMQHTPSLFSGQALWREAKEYVIKSGRTWGGNATEGEGACVPLGALIIFPLITKSWAKGIALILGARHAWPCSPSCGSHYVPCPFSSPEIKARTWKAHHLFLWRVGGCT